MRSDTVHSYLRDLVHQVTGTSAETDSDGYLIVEQDGALLRTRVLNPADPVIQISMIAIEYLEESPGLHTRINAINSEIGFARAYWVPAALVIESEIWANDVNPGNFEFNIINIAAVATRHAAAVIEEFGGRRPLSHGDQQLQLEPNRPSIAADGGYL